VGCREWTEHQVEDADPWYRQLEPGDLGDRVFAVTAISKAGDNTFKTGLYGDVKPGGRSL
jgi:hypothetical protein